MVATVLSMVAVAYNNIVNASKNVFEACKTQTGAPFPHIVYIAPQRHGGGANYTFADGHAKWFKGPSASWRARSMSGVAWRRSLAPNAVAWFRED